MFAAIENGDADQVESILKSGANPDEIDSRVPLITAVFGYDTPNNNRNPRIVKLLVDAGADVENLSMIGENPVCIVIRNGYKELLQILVKSPTFKRTYETTYLESALRRLNVDIIEILIKNGVHSSVNKSIGLMQCVGHIMIKTSSKLYNNRKLRVMEMLLKMDIRIPRLLEKLEERNFPEMT